MQILWNYHQDVFQTKRTRASSHSCYLYECVGIFDISTFEMIDGDLPPKAQSLVKEWLENNYNKLIEMWNTQIITKLEPLK